MTAPTEAIIRSISRDSNTSLPATDSQEVSGQEAPLLPRPVSMRSAAVAVPSGWEQFPHPQELQLLPDGQETPHEIIQIVKQSLQKREEELLVPPQTKDVECREEKTVELQQPNVQDPDKCETGSNEQCTDISSPAVGDETDRASASSARGKSGVSRFDQIRTKTGFLNPVIDRLATRSSKVDTNAAIKAMKKREKMVAKEATLVECVSCFDDIPQTAGTTLTCKHTYCKTCFTALITTAMQTEEIFPPKCCLTEAPLKKILYALDSDQRTTYKDKAAEWGQPASKRLYCPEPKCAKWIAPSKTLYSRSGQKCPYCKIAICAICRAPAHAGGAECPQDFGLRATLDAAEREGWRRCYSCRSLVERSVGCRHMTCNCKAQFCYTCGSKWKTCACTEVDDARQAQQLQTRRDQANAAAQREEEEIAKAIAEVEAWERREEQRRRQAEMAEERRWRRKEERRRIEEEEATLMILLSIDERIEVLTRTLTELALIQQLALTSRHQSIKDEVVEMAQLQRAKRQKKCDSTKQKMLANIERRSRLLTDRHGEEEKAMKSRHEEEQDAVFMEIQLHLKGQPNKEKREKKMLDELKKAQRVSMDELLTRQAAEADALKITSSMEARGLEHGSRLWTKEEEQIQETKMLGLETMVVMERKWFDVVTERRRALLQQLRQDQIDTMGESRHLGEWERLPFPTAGVDGSDAPDLETLIRRAGEIEKASRVKTEIPDVQDGEEGGEADSTDASMAKASDVSSAHLEARNEVEAVPPQSEAKQFRDQTDLPDKAVYSSEKEVDPSPQHAQQPISPAAVEAVATEESSQSVWEIKLQDSGTDVTANTSRFSFSHSRTSEKRRFSSLFRRSSKEPIDRETWEGLLRKSIGDAW